MFKGVALSFLVNKLLRKNDSTALEFKRQERLAIHQGESQEPGSQEYMELTNRAGFLLNDQPLMDFLMSTPSLSDLEPILSPTNSPIKLSKYQAELKRIRLDNFITLKKLTMDPKVYNANGLEWLESLRMYGHDRISGAEEGWIGHIATETTRRHVFEERKSKE